ncbi:hypothetical protein Ancab_020058 [Ancistrocladus abbreviatus]
MFEATTSNSTSLSEEVSISSGTRAQDFACLNPILQTATLLNSTDHQHQHPKKPKKKRSLPGNPDPDAEVIALSPKTLLATNRFVCEICNKGFQRDQNLQLHRRGHNLPWKLKQRNNKEVKKRVYVCPEPTCVHHHPSRALGDLTGVKKHFCRKHGDKKFKCEKCSKIYAVYSDWKAHSKTCGTREYRCDCGSLFSRKDSFITHRAFCDALAEESARLSANTTQIETFTTLNPQNPSPTLFPFSNPPPTTMCLTPRETPHNPAHNTQLPIKLEAHHHLQQPPPPPPLPMSAAASITSSSNSLLASPFATLHMISNTRPANTPNAAVTAHLSATALLQKACTMGHVMDKGTGTMEGFVVGPLGHMAADVESTKFIGVMPGDLATWQTDDGLTRDFLGLTGDHYSSGNGGNEGAGGGGGANVSLNVEDVLKFRGLEYSSVTPMAMYGDRDHSLLKAHGFDFIADPAPATPEAWGDC